MLRKKPYDTWIYFIHCLNRRKQHDERASISNIKALLSNLYAELSEMFLAVKWSLYFLCILDDGASALMIDATKYELQN